MGEHTNIHWCDSTVNPTSGCDGCELWNAQGARICYAGHLHENRLAKSIPSKYDPDFFNVREIPGRMRQAAGWSDLYGRKRPDKPWMDGLPRCIFVGDLGDFMSVGISFEFLATELVGAMSSSAGQRHFWMLLTKRPARLREFSKQYIPSNLRNWMAMTTVTDQRTAMLRIPQLLSVRAPIHGISAEPLFGPIDFLGPIGFDWVIFGGASGKGAFPCNIDWIRMGARRCREAGVPVFVKQWGSIPGTSAPPELNTSITVAQSLKDPKGADWNEWPEDIRIRQMPNILASYSNKGDSRIGGRESK